jgi:hypothetical protein
VETRDEDDGTGAVQQQTSRVAQPTMTPPTSHFVPHHLLSTDADTLGGVAESR